MTEPPGPSWVSPPAFATDYDRTLAEPGHGPDPLAMQAIQRLRTAGVRCILATGRSAQDLLDQGLAANDFDAYVVEGGAFWGGLDRLSYLQVGGELQAAQARCKEAGVLVIQRRSSFAVPRANEAQVRALVGGCSVQPNVDHVDILPPLVDKGLGLDGALGSLGNRGLPVVAIGDGENDIPLFARATLGIATGNAVPALRAAAHIALDEVGPAAVVAAADRLLAGEWNERLNLQSRP